jgi:hypothetical protein
MAKLRIGVLYDYWWDEDEERVEGERPKKKSPDDDVQAVYEALRKAGHNPVFVRIDGTRESLIELARSQTDLLFNLTESFAGDDGQDTNLAGYLELLGRRLHRLGLERSVPGTGQEPREEDLHLPRHPHARTSAPSTAAAPSTRTTSSSR